jgi:hypothetical protein
VARALALQRSAGNRATAQVLARDKDVTIGSETVTVADDPQAEEVKKLIAGIKSKYGVDVDSAQGVKSTLATYKDAPQEERDKVKAKPWTVSELKALDRALGHFQRVLGSKRATSTRKDVAQEVTTVGKATFSISSNTASGKVDRTLGQYYRSDKNFTMYGRGEVSTIDFPGNVAKQQEATATHEIAHGVMEYCLGDFMTTIGYWSARNAKTGTSGAEAPPTKYGDKNAAEDLCESVMLYFVDPDRLKTGETGKTTGTPGNPCPKRFAFLAKVIDGWEPPVVHAQADPSKMGDFDTAPITDSSSVAV